MNCIIAGGRSFKPNRNHYYWLVNTLKIIKPDNIVCGMCKGADMFGFHVAQQLGFPILEYPANWDENGKKAGFIRNEQMAQVSDICILFEGGKGTNNMRSLAKLYGLEIIEYGEK